jgi:hypothetical protein
MLDFIQKADMPKKVTSKYIKQNPLFTKNTYVLWYRNDEQDPWEYENYEILGNALNKAKSLGLDSKNWVITQVMDYGSIK